VRLAAVLSVVVSLPASGAGPLFPAPIHLTRQVHDPISDTTTVFDEYASGNRLVSIRGGRTSIADYEKGELTEIDRDAGTYSVTRFDAIARATKNQIAPPAKSTVTAGGVRATKLQRSAETFQAEIESTGAKESIDIAVDPTVRLSREALEVLVGAAYPGVRTAEHDAVITAAAGGQQRRVSAQSTSSQSAEQTYALPVEQTVRYDIDGQKIETHTAVVRVGNETPPPDLLAIPAGAQKVTSRIVEVARELERLENPAMPPKD
jgi:hypothetical protein